MRTDIPMITDSEGTTTAMKGKDGQAGWRRLLVLSLAVAVSFGSLSWGLAQTVPSGFTVGKITARTGAGIQIDQRGYTLHKDVVVKDTLGRTWKVKHLDPGAEVMFHAKRGKIDRIIIVIRK